MLPCVTELRWGRVDRSKLFYDSQNYNLYLKFCCRKFSCFIIILFGPSQLALYLRELLSFMNFERLDSVNLYLIIKLTFVILIIQVLCFELIKYPRHNEYRTQENLIIINYFKREYLARKRVRYNVNSA